MPILRGQGIRLLARASGLPPRMRRIKDCLPGDPADLGHMCFLRCVGPGQTLTRELLGRRNVSRTHGSSTARAPVTAPQYAPPRAVRKAGGRQRSGPLVGSFNRRQGGSKSGCFRSGNSPSRPVLDAVRPRRVVEIGALRGETTDVDARTLGADAELHVIDPVPEFDPGRARTRVPRPLHLPPRHQPQRAAAPPAGGRRAHRRRPQLVHRVPRAPDAERDGRETRDSRSRCSSCTTCAGRTAAATCTTRRSASLRSSASRTTSGACARIARSCSRGGGLNPTMNNAVTEGGERNGVMTALDDFMAEYDRPLRRVVLPIYFGLAIVAEEARLRDDPELAAVLDRLESGEGKHELLELAESVRLQAMLFQHNVFYHREGLLERAATRYLDLLEGGVARRALPRERGAPRVPRGLHRAQADARSGEAPRPGAPDEARNARSGEQPSRGRFAGAHRWLSHSCPTPTWAAPASTPREVPRHGSAANGVEGDLVECGTGRGGGAIFMRGYLEAHETRRPTGLGRRHLPRVGARQRRACSTCRPTSTSSATASSASTCSTTRPLPAGPVPRDAPRRRDRGGRAAADRRRRCSSATRDVLDALYGKVAPGGIVVVDDYAAAACRRRSTTSVPRTASSNRSSASTGPASGWQKQPDEGPHRRRPLPPSTRRRRPLAPPQPAHDQGPLGRRRLLQHAARGARGRCTRCHAPTSRASKTSTTR